MLLNELFKNAPAIQIDQLSTDSRMPMENCIFFCIKGVRYDGHDFVKDAIINGANVIVYQDDIDTSLNAVFIKVNDVFSILIQIAEKFYDYPGNKLDTYLICGCYGRSSVSYYINQLLSTYKKTGSIGAMGVEYDEKTLYSSYSTLPILNNFSHMSSMLNDGIETCTFESNPLNISLHKLDCVHPNIFTYTSTSYNSHDYREVGKDYYDMIRKYFYTLDADVKILLNNDDDSFDELYEDLPNVYSYGIDPNSDFIIYDVNLKNNGTSFALRYNGQNTIISTSLLGFENVYNVTAAIATLTLDGYDFEELCMQASELINLQGIYDRIEDNDYNIIVDSAYTIDSMTSILKFANEITSSKNRIITIFGIAYTDDEKRIESLINTVKEYSDLVIITEDDSYKHSIYSVLSNALDKIDNKKAIMIEDRKSAIESGIELLNNHDTLLILGKGNEQSIFKGLGKEFYKGDKHYALYYLNKRKEEENEII